MASWVTLEGATMGLTGYTVMYDVETANIAAFDNETGELTYFYINGNPDSNWPTAPPGQFASIDDRQEWAIDATNASIDYAYSQAEALGGEGEYTPGDYTSIGGEAMAPESLSAETRERQERTRTYGGQAAAWIGWPGGPTTAAAPVATVAPPAAAPVSAPAPTGTPTEGWTMTPPDANGVYTVISPDQKTAYQLQRNAATGKHDVVGRWYASSRPVGEGGVNTFEPFAQAAPTAPVTPEAVAAAPVKRAPIPQGPTKSQQIRAETVSQYFNPAVGGYTYAQPPMSAKKAAQAQERINWLKNRYYQTGVGWVTGQRPLPEAARAALQKYGVTTGPTGQPVSVEPPVETKAETAVAEPTAPWLENLQTGKVSREWEFPMAGLPRFPSAQQWYAMSESEKEGLKGSVESNQGYWPDYYDWMIRSWVPGTETRLRPKWGW